MESGVSVPVQGMGYGLSRVQVNMFLRVVIEFVRKGKIKDRIPSTGVYECGHRQNWIELDWCGEL